MTERLDLGIGIGGKRWKTRNLLVSTNEARWSRPYFKLVRIILASEEAGKMRRGVENDYNDSMDWDGVSPSFQSLKSLSKVPSEAYAFSIFGTYSPRRAMLFSFAR